MLYDTVPISTRIVNRNSIVQHAIKTVRGQVSIDFNLSVNGFVNLSVYNSKGALVKGIMKGYLKAGTHSFSFGNNGLSNGVYYYKLVTKDTQITESFVVAR